VPTLAWYRARGLWDDGLVPAHPTPDSADEDGRDRQALESILGHPLSDSPWPATALATGTRVRVIKDQAWDGPWATEFLGVIIDTLGVPELVRHPRAHPGELEYWVKFDEPQFDADGDGRIGDQDGLGGLRARLRVTRLGLEAQPVGVGASDGVDGLTVGGRPR
jgi:hypothetical protein